MPIIVIFLFLLFSAQGFSQASPGQFLLLKDEDAQRIKLLNSKQEKKIKKQNKSVKKNSSKKNHSKKQQKVRRALVDKYFPVKVPVNEKSSRSPASVNEEEESYLESLLIGNKKQLQQFKEFLHPEDPRRNIFELHFQPFLVYLDRDSNSWYKKSTTSSLGFGIGANFWVTPQLGFSAQYGGTTGAKEKASPTDGSSLESLHEWMELAVLYRKSYGVSRTSPRLIYKFGFQNYEHSIPVDASNRVGLTQAGLLFSVTGVLPLKKTHLLSLTGGLRPFQSLREVDTGISVSSGDLVSAHGLDLSAKYEVYFRRQNNIYVELKYSFDSAVYRGASSPSDPKTNATIQGVDVQSHFVILSVGHKWGR